MADTTASASASSKHGDMSNSAASGSSHRSRRTVPTHKYSQTVIFPPTPPDSRPPSFLRASCAFSPICSPVDPTIFLPMNEGDVILVHSIDRNGWADGTLLASGARGWLPTNYCGAYDPEEMRNGGLRRSRMSLLSELSSANCRFFGVLEDDRRRRRAPVVMDTIFEENSIPSTPRLSTYDSRDSSLASQTSTLLTATVVALKTQPSLSMSSKEGQVAGGSLPAIMDFDPSDMAYQLTRRQSNIFCSIMRGELHESRWTKKDGLGSPNVKAMIALSTDITNLVVYTILQYSEVNTRAAAIEQWIKVARKCLELHNYDALVAINGGVNSPNIIRLRRTWAKVSPEYQQKLGEIQAIVAPAENNGELRRRLVDHSLPCLPFLGMYLTELNFVNERDPTDDGQRIVNKLLRFETQYPLITEEPDIQYWITSQIGRVHELKTGDMEIPDVLYEKSKKLEPPTVVAASRRTRVPSMKRSWIDSFTCMRP